ncbi:hypothetical protein QJS10_CPB13g00613 [Acorus calamus]|uniref:Uncharacterized protein n=1 Tax=Acorus calamus TaxID=4465 RepID=A0AAV9DIJ4_ACOCL|nr:hypothetical protein QJS10_CPB13g00613 [Acorus calamus]
MTPLLALPLSSKTILKKTQRGGPTSSGAARMAVPTPCAWRAAGIGGGVAEAVSVERSEHCGMDVVASPSGDQFVVEHGPEHGIAAGVREGRRGCLEDPLAHVEPHAVRFLLRIWRGPASTTACISFPQLWQRPRVCMSVFATLQLYNK